jgi:hypothetical protein
MDSDDAKNILEEALTKLLDNDFVTFGETTGERPMMFRIAHYMIARAEAGGQLTVDCEYNRHGNDIKTLPPKDETISTAAGQVARRFSPDIVLHERGTNAQNILVCEIKRVSTSGWPRAVVSPHRCGGVAF